MTYQEGVTNECLQRVQSALEDVQRLMQIIKIRFRPSGTSGEVYKGRDTPLEIDYDVLYIDVNKAKD